ncbi:hypothetical protein [Streptomyces botrytidirepellens]|uniref:hypothetical protein n=1 Tax=Streptomyces botrytidirepellens TaxID=2486417 RepID=UPI0011CD3EF8|nr:hypothetical protein [Streptomyces botrytidirepellens]
MREVGLRLGALTSTEEIPGLDADEALVRRLLTGAGPDIWAKDSILVRALRLRPAFSVERAASTPVAAPGSRRSRMLKRIDRLSPRRRIRVTLVLAWRVAQHGGEVVKLKHRDTYRLDFTLGNRVDWVQGHRFSGTTRVKSKDLGFSYHRRLPGKFPE